MPGTKHTKKPDTKRKAASDVEQTAKRTKIDDGGDSSTERKPKQEERRQPPRKTYKQRKAKRHASSGETGTKDIRDRAEVPGRFKKFNEPVQSFYSTPLEYVPYIPIKRRKRVADSDEPWRKFREGAVSEENVELLVRYQEPPACDIIYTWMDGIDDKKDPCLPSLFCYITRGNCRVFVTRKDTRCNTLQTLLPSTRAEAERWMLEVMRANPDGRYSTEVRSHGKGMLMMLGVGYEYFNAADDAPSCEGYEGSVGMVVQDGSMTETDEARSG
ncbi:hypothetical protein LTR27_003900 [Elasticomyces elasticus]|nr:hypothetical protein LTR27_003900 [Elasticomyces elasticus]